MYISFKEISLEQKKPLDYKIDMARKAIEQGFKASVSRPAIAFSGGKDSTVLWHLIKTHFPEQHEKTIVIFGNTGVEYPESLDFARKLGREWGGDNFFEANPERLIKAGLKYKAQQQVLEYLIESGKVNSVLKADGKLKSTLSLEKACPSEMWKRFRAEKLVWEEGTLKSYWWCVDQYGYPILGKAASKLKARRINIDCFLRFSRTSSNKEELAEYYDILNKVKISQACCDILKKEPSERLQAQLKIDVLFKGLMAEESQMRKMNFCTRGYLFKSSRDYIGTPFYHCNPLSIWTDSDIWRYIRQFNVPYSPLYDLTYTDCNGTTCCMKRNGCIGCFTDYGRKNNHMFVLRQTHPERWNAVMKYGMAEEIQKLKTSGNNQYRHQTILDALVGADNETYKGQIDWIIENRPCAFD